MSEKKSGSSWLDIAEVLSGEDSVKVEHIVNIPTATALKLAGVILAGIIFAAILRKSGK